jgi:hypothetical protein
MSVLFRKPFLTDRFDSRGGGIDFLGMRGVNLSMLEDELIPGINNATADLGTFFLGAWIPWKFRHLCQKEDFVLSKYDAFRDAVEVAMTYTTRAKSPAEEMFGRSRRRMGVQHQPVLPGPLTFKAAGRSRATSLYAGPLYGPSLRHLGLLQAADALATDGTSTGIPLASEDRQTQEIVDHVERSLAASPHFSTVVHLKTASVSGEALDDLGRHGLHPSFYRKTPDATKRAFLEKFFAADFPGERRRLTAALVCRTVTEQSVTHLEALRRIWYTNLLDSGVSLVLDDPSVRDHRLRWAVFQARQIQRTILELFLRCFELAVGAGCRAIDQVIDHWRDRSPEEFEGMLTSTVGNLIHTEARAVYRGTDMLKASRAWNATVHGAHACFDEVPWSDEDAELICVLRTLARWWLRMLTWVGNETLPASIEAGRCEQLSMGWFHRWVGEWMQSSLTDLLRELFSNLIFAQHVKVALMRFDGNVQRLRFTLGDEGIIPTAEVGKKLGKYPGRMADRLDSFIGILCDAGMLAWQKDGRLAVQSTAALQRNRNHSQPD